MAENREKSASILLRFAGKNEDQQSVKFDVFPAEKWRGGTRGHFRVQRDGKFLDSDNGAHAYLTPERIGALVAKHLAQETQTRTRENLPRIPPRTPVRVVKCVLAGQEVCDKARTVAPPHTGPDGRYMIWCYIPEDGYREIPYKNIRIDRMRPLTEAQRDYFETAQPQENPQ